MTCITQVLERFADHTFPVGATDSLQVLKFGQVLVDRVHPTQLFSATHSCVSGTHREGVVSEAF